MSRIPISSLCVANALYRDGRGAFRPQRTRQRRGRLAVADGKRRAAAQDDGKTLKVYCDGALASAKNIGKARQPGSGSLWFGRRADGYLCFNGSIDEVRIYKRALTEAEVKAHFTAPEKIVKDADQVGYWDFTAAEEEPDFVKLARAKAGLESPFRSALLGQE